MSKSAGIELHNGMDFAALVKAYERRRVIANDLFDVLEKLCTVALSPVETHAARHEAIDLMERVESEVKVM